MAILRNDTTIRSADGQSTSAIITAANIGNYGISTTSTYYIGTTQNVFNRASASQTLTGVSIDGNAATVTNGVYTTGTQSISGAKTFNDASTFGSNVTLTGTSQLFIGSYMSLQSSATILGMVGFNRKVSDGTIFNSSYAAYQLHNDTGTLNLQIYTSAGGFVGAHTFNSSGNITFIGSTTSSTDLRAPVFYDTNNTAYYCDPASVSNLNAVTLNRSGSDGYLTLPGSVTVSNVSGAEMVIRGLSQLRFSNSTSWDWNSWAGLRYDNAGTTIYLGGPAATGIFTQNATPPTVTVSFVGTNNVTSDSNFKAPIFYDSANTAYYLDPANTGTSLLVAGNVGIGTTSPGYILDVRGDIRIGNGTSGEQDIRFVSLNGDWQVGTNNGGNGTNNNQFYFYDNAYRLTIQTGTGNVGIGTTSPSYILDANSTNDNAIRIRNGAGSANNGLALSVGSGSPWLDIIEGVEFRIKGNTYANIGTWNSGNNTKLLINSSGNVGIGTTSPSQKLHVVGTGFASTDFRAPIFYDSDNTAYYIDPASTSVLNRINLNTAATAAIQWRAAGVGTISGGYPFYNNASYGSINIEVTDNDSGGLVIDNEGVTVYGAADNGQLFRTIDEDVYQTNGNNVANATTFWINQGADGGGVIRGTFSATADFRAPIFYDSNDTNYYLDAASTSSLNILNVASYIDVSTYIYLRNNLRMLNSAANGWLETIVRNSGNPYFQNSIDGGTFLASDVSENNNWLFQENVRGWGIFYFNRGTQSGQTFGSYTTVGAETFIIGQGTGTTMTSTWTGYNASSKVAIMLSNYSGYIWANDTIFSAAGMRAPIFYDSNDTSYYIDPASTSLLNATRHLNIVAGSNAGMTSSGQLAVYSSANPYISFHDGGVGRTAYFQETGGRFYFGEVTYTESEGSFRAPSFYDVNNTSYYVDPASTSILNNIRTATISAANHGLTCVYYGGSATPTNGYLITTNIDYSTFNMPTVIIEGYAYGNAAPIHLEIVWYAYNNSWTNLSYTNLGAWDPGTISIGTNASGKVCLHLSGLIYYGRFNVRCIYDQGNVPLEGWTVTDATTSALTRVTTISKSAIVTSITGNSATTTLATKATRANGNFYIDDNYGNTVVGVYSASRFQGVFAMGDSYKLSTDGSTTGTLYGIAWSHPNAGGVAANLNTHGALIMENGTFLAALSGSIRSRDDMRSPIFYDSNNTAYYLDPASGSNLNNVTVAGTLTLTNIAKNSTAPIVINSGQSASLGLRVYYDMNLYNTLTFTDSAWNSQGAIFGSGGNVTINAATATTSFVKYAGYSQEGGSFRAPIFYDSDDTNFYANPAGESKFNYLRLTNNNALYFTTTGVAELNNEGNSTNVAFRMIKSGSSNSDGNNYGVLNLQRTNHTNAATNAGASIFFELKDSGGTIREYAGISGCKTEAGAAGGRLIFHRYARTEVGFWDADQLYSSSSVRTPIFYDSDNTGYYLNPAGSSQLSSVYANDWFRAQGNTGLYFQDKGYGITSAGAASNSYGNASTYGSGLNGWQGWGIGSRHCMMSTGGDNFGIHDNTRSWLYYWDGTYHRFQYGYLESANSVRGPLFYDSDNTSYYCDPASTSILNIVNNRENTPGGSGNTYYWSGSAMSFYWTKIANVSGGNTHAAILITYKTDVNYNPFGLALLSVSAFNSQTFSVKLEKLNGDSMQILVRVDNNNDVWLLTAAEWSSYKTWKVISKLGSPTVYYSSLTEQLTTPANSIEIASGQEVRGTQGAATSATISTVANHLIGGLTVRSDVRAPIFYDSDNTGYYLNPAGSSNLSVVTAGDYYTGGWFRSNVSGYGIYNQVTGEHFYSDDASYWNVASSSTVQGIRLRTGGYGGTVRGYFYADNNNDVGLLNNSGNWRVRIVGGDYVLFDGSSIRAPIFYDSNDTNYYVDPAGTSYLNYSIFNGLSSADYTRQFAPSGGYFYAGGAQTGAIKIRMPANSKALYPMLSFTCHIYNYSTGTSRTFKIGGHFSNSSWYNPFAYCLSESAGNLNVRWGYEGNYLVVWIGETSSGWSYPCVFITDFQNGYSAINNSWMTGWNVSLVTAFDTVTNGPTAAGFFWNQNNDGSGSGLDADLVDGLEVHTARNDNANKIVRTDSNGYIQAGWINTTSGDQGTSAIDRVYASYDGYIRYYTPANFRTVLDVPTRGGSGASGSWGISITGSSASCTGNAANVTGTVAVANGGTGATTAANAATNLGLGTGNTPKFLNVFGERIALNSSSPQTINTQYNVTELTLTSSISTLTFSNIQAAGIVHMWTLVTVGNATAYSITWPAAVKWPGGTAPTITSTNTKRDIYQFVTYDGGTNIYAIIVGQNL